VWLGLSCIISLSYTCWSPYVKCIWSLHHGKSTTKFLKLLTNCFKRIVSFIAIITIKVMCIQFAEHFSRGRHPNFQQLQACSWERWVNIVNSFLNNKFSKYLQYTNDVYFLFWFQTGKDIWRNSYFKNASSLIKCYTT